MNDNPHPRIEKQPYDPEFMRTTIKAAMSDAVHDLITRREFDSFRMEMLEALKLYYNREMVDRFRDENKAEIKSLREDFDALKKDSEKTQLNLDNLWQNAFVRLAFLAGAIYTILQLWQSLHH